jgi:hypothetical protein
MRGALLGAKWLLGVWLKDASADDASELGEATS